MQSNSEQRNKRLLIFVSSFPFSIHYHLFYCFFECVNNTPFEDGWYKAGKICWIPLRFINNLNSSLMKQDIALAKYTSRHSIARIPLNCVWNSRQVHDIRLDPPQVCINSNQDHISHKWISKIHTFFSIAVLDIPSHELELHLDFSDPECQYQNLGMATTHTSSINSFHVFYSYMDLMKLLLHL